MRGAWGVPPKITFSISLIRYSSHPCGSYAGIRKGRSLLRGDWGVPKNLLVIHFPHKMLLTSLRQLCRDSQGAEPLARGLGCPPKNHLFHFPHKMLLTSLRLPNRDIERICSLKVTFRSILVLLRRFLRNRYSSRLPQRHHHHSFFNDPILRNQQISPMVKITG